MRTEIELDVAIRMLHELQKTDGDIGAQYWREISQLLQAAAAFRNRALVAEQKLKQITALIDKPD